MSVRPGECAYCNTDHPSGDPCPELDGTEIKCVVACGYAGDGPGFVPVRIRCTRDQYDNGDHYEAAKAVAREADAEGPFVVFDEHDGPAWLFQQFKWDATVHDVVGVDAEDAE